MPTRSGRESRCSPDAGRSSGMRAKSGGFRSTRGRHGSTHVAQASCASTASRSCAGAGNSQPLHCRGQPRAPGFQPDVGWLQVAPHDRARSWYNGQRSRTRSPSTWHCAGPARARRHSRLPGTRRQPSPGPSCVRGDAGTDVHGRVAEPRRPGAHVDLPPLASQHPFSHFHRAAIAVSPGTSTSRLVLVSGVRDSG